MSGVILLTPFLPEWLPLPSDWPSPPVWWGRALLKSLLAGCSGGVYPRGLGSGLDCCRRFCIGSLQLETTGFLEDLGGTLWGEPRGGRWANHTRV